MTAQLTAVGVYHPRWHDAHGATVTGPDEDVATMAVAAGRVALRHMDEPPVVRVVVVSRTPDYVEGATAAVVALGIGLPVSCPVEERLGGPPDALDAVTSAQPGTLVIGVDIAAPSVAAAVLVGESGAAVTAGGRTGGSLPMRVHGIGQPAARVYDDPRLLREEGWNRVVEELRGTDDPHIVCGISERQLKRIAHGGDRLDPPPGVGAAAPLLALAQLLDGDTQGRVIAVEGAVGAAADVAAADGEVVVTHDAGPRHAAPPSWAPEHDAEIPLALPAYVRAFEPKVGLVAAECRCGILSYPPRSLCIECGSTEPTVPHVLPRTGEVYTGTTVHAGVPGRWGPYSLAVVQLDNVAVRMLVHVTDAPAGTAQIGGRGGLVLRHVADREGVPDYGYAFRPAEEVADQEEVLA